jgi:hypothetical protein
VTYLLDVNVLIALIDPARVEYEAAQSGRINPLKAPGP